MAAISYRTIAKQIGISPQAVERLVKSTKVPDRKMTASVESSADFEIGLRIDKKFLETDICPGGFSEQQIIFALNAYAKASPAVYNWLCSGNFTSDRLPETVTRALLIHACRTAGRIRAELIKSGANSQRS